MSNDTKTLQERLRSFASLLNALEAKYSSSLPGKMLDEAADILDAKDALLREAREVLSGVEHFSDALAWREDHLSMAMREWTNAIPAPLLKLNEAET